MNDEEKKGVSSCDADDCNNNNNDEAFMGPRKNGERANNLISGKSLRGGARNCRG